MSCFLRSSFTLSLCFRLALISVFVLFFFSLSCLLSDLHLSSSASCMRSYLTFATPSRASCKYQKKKGCFILELSCLVCLLRPHPLHCPPSAPSIMVRRSIIRLELCIALLWLLSSLRPMVFSPQTHCIHLDYPAFRHMDELVLFLAFAAIHTCLVHIHHLSTHTANRSCCILEHIPLFLGVFCVLRENRIILIVISA